MDIDTRVFQLSLQKQCCSQIVMKVGLELLEKDNPDLVKAMKGLCYGVSVQSTCGALSAGACLLSLYGVEKYIPKLVNRFENEFGSKECNVLIGKDGGDPVLCNKITDKLKIIV